MNDTPRPLSRQADLCSTNISIISSTLSSIPKLIPIFSLPSIVSLNSLYGLRLSPFLSLSHGRSTDLYDPLGVQPPLSPSPSSSSYNLSLLSGMALRAIPRLFFGGRESFGVYPLDAPPKPDFRLG